MNSIRILLFLIPISLAFLGCQTPGVVLEDSDYSVKQHRVAITAALAQIRAVSQNGRELYSYYHDRNFKAFEVTTKTKERLYTKAVILGPRRPYNLSVEVHIERRDPDSKQFQDLGIDNKLSRKRALAIKQMLNQSREDATTFDEETPF